MRQENITDMSTLFIMIIRIMNCCVYQDVNPHNKDNKNVLLKNISC
jgi:hypothetical protein